MDEYGLRRFDGMSLEGLQGGARRRRRDSRRGGKSAGGAVRTGGGSIPGVGLDCSGLTQ